MFTTKEMQRKVIDNRKRGQAQKRRVNTVEGEAERQTEETENIKIKVQRRDKAAETETPGQIETQRERLVA